MVNSKVLLRVLRIRFGNSVGTAFTIERNGIQFIVTAKHLFRDQSFPNRGMISLLLDSQYHEMSADIRYPSNDKVDIAVIRLNPYCEVTQKFNNGISSNGVTIGQDVYFLGFPYEYDMIVAKFPNHTRPVPFVNKACFSAIMDGGNTFFLDGINNPGFSGSPVCFESIGNEISILGVVSGYRNDKQMLVSPGNLQTGYYINSNSGIIVVARIEPALEVADNWKD